MSMLWRNWTAFIAVLATTLSILAVLSILQYETVLSRLIQERLAVVAETTASSFRSVINLGLPIASVRNAKEVLAWAEDIDPAVTSIQVFNPTGIIVHSTIANGREPIAKDTLIVQSLSADDRWDTENDSELQAGLTLRNLQGDRIGGILVSAANTDFKEKSRTMSFQIASAAAVIFVVFSLLALLMLRIKLGSAMHGLEKLERLSDEYSEDQKNSRLAETKAPFIADDGFLSSEIVELESKLDAAFRKFKSVRRIISEFSNHNQKVADVGQENTASLETAIAPAPETALANVFARSLSPWSAAIILGSALVLGLYAHNEVTRSLEPELAARTKVIGAVANRNIQRAVNAGVPLTNLVGAENYFSELLKHFPEVSYFGVATGRIVYEAGTRQNYIFAPAQSRKDVPTFPIIADGNQIGYIIVDINPDYFALQFRDMLLDFGVVVLVVMLLAFQIITVVMSRSLTAPFLQLQYLAGLQAAGDFSSVIVAKGLTAIDRLNNKLSEHAMRLHRAFTAATSHQSNNSELISLEKLGDRFKLRHGWPTQLKFSYLNDVRLPLFLFAAADQLPIAFLPIFTRAANNSLPWLDTGIVISLPIAGYLIAIVVGSLLVRPLTGKFGHRKLLLYAAAPTLLAHIGLYASTDVTEIVVFRMVTGLGYAFAVMACQDYVLRAVPKKDRNRSLGLFTAALFSGIFAGTALGGILADRLGQPSVFVVSAGLVLLSGTLTYRLLPTYTGKNVSAPIAHTSYLPPIWRPLGNPQFAALVFGIAVPANILLQAFISFLVALELNALGASTADTSRILMTYFLAIVFVGPAAPHFLERKLNPSQVGLLGAVLSAVSLCAVVIWPAQWSILVAVAGAGISHGLIRDPQVAAALEIAERDLVHLDSDIVLASLRAFERLGSIVGLLLIAFLSSYVGYLNAIAAIVVIVITGAAAFALTFYSNFFSSQSQRTEESQQADTD
ncbi:MFS transporter [Sneathiella sp. CAU 1612]|uniref:MFS transporter n=1 Tax=Sneathiella sedimenti TaxID=2816034 RepID=A0ABS3F8S2_9PROT|nr:MFS transporter [Sneathiella sedimenti]MBO0334923.1 MFS transporter [Sneathiella sedimenti]